MSTQQNQIQVFDIQFTVNCELDGCYPVFKSADDATNKKNLIAMLKSITDDYRYNEINNCDDDADLNETEDQANQKLHLKNFIEQANQMIENTNTVEQERYFMRLRFTSGNACDTVFELYITSHALFGSDSKPNTDVAVTADNQATVNESDTTKLDLLPLNDVAQPLTRRDQFAMHALLAASIALKDRSFVNADAIAHTAVVIADKTIAKLDATTP